MYDVLKKFADPYFFLLLIMGLGLIVGWLRSDRKGFWMKIVSLCWLSLYLLSIPLVSQVLSETLESQNPQDKELPEKIDSIIVLGGGVLPPSVDNKASLDEKEEEKRAKTFLSYHSWMRCQHAMELYNQLDQPELILCGAKVLTESPGIGEAETMQNYFVNQGIPAEKIHLEHKSRNTFENIKNAAELLSKKEEQQVLLVTHAYHLPRAVLCCNKQGLEVSVSGCGYHQKQHWRPWYTDVIPSLGNFARSQNAIHEWIGIVWYRVSGKL